MDLPAAKKKVLIIAGAFTVIAIYFITATFIHHFMKKLINESFIIYALGITFVLLVLIILSLFAINFTAKPTKLGFILLIDTILVLFYCIYIIYFTRGSIGSYFSPILITSIPVVWMCTNIKLKDFIKNKEDNKKIPIIINELKVYGLIYAIIAFIAYCILSTYFKDIFIKNDCDLSLLFVISTFVSIVTGLIVTESSGKVSSSSTL